MEILGLLDALESLVLDGFKIPLSRKTMVNEEKVLAIIDKIRLVAQSGGGIAKKAVSGEAPRSSAAARELPPELSARISSSGGTASEGKAVEVIQQAYQIAKEVRLGADRYADEVLTNLEATSSRVLRAVRAGREKLQKSIGVDEIESIPLPSKGNARKEEASV
ncbi:MAG: hypothetical protein KKB81_00715 [Candidatus Margulisbacteria bacterium]|nr:hypothetical protein [Candidatus Margulisiibacteriota bacterium]MBU1021500.1 hypothetical protein [Candidatus Margulisiibacteriota bacterium]MBU1728585.1 hypothetical protein [Candidatus Margulisiibacteriota bacterium]MBU1955836.1 hypothetical protein [Candidatus Margulisiibacteriota bacterium]